MTEVVAVDPLATTAASLLRPAPDDEDKEEDEAEVEKTAAVRALSGEDPAEAPVVFMTISSLALSMLLLDETSMGSSSSAINKTGRSTPGNPRSSLLLLLILSPNTNRKTVIYSR